MSNLIERVARAAGWHYANGNAEQWEHGTFSRVTAVRGTLTDAGLVLLLRELLEAGWYAGKENGRFIVDTTLSPKPHRGGYEYYTADTLEEAVLLAYDAHK